MFHIIILICTGLAMEGPPGQKGIHLNLISLKIDEKWKKNESTVIFSWMILGSVGLRGPKGDYGTIGDKGDTGFPGNPGYPGDKGDAGKV